MDIYCPICGEPWEMDTLHDVASERYGVPYNLDGKSIYDPDYRGKNPFYNDEEYQKIYSKVSSDFRKEGCKALAPEFGRAEYCMKKKNQPKDSLFGLTAAEASSVLFDILGDDLDGAAAIMDDMYY